MQFSPSALRDFQRERPERAPVVARMLDLVAAAGEPFSRRQFLPGHFTASAFVVCPERRQLLLVHHAKLGRWLQPGGHVEAGDLSLFAAARREAIEETGVQGLRPLQAITGGAFELAADATPQPTGPGALPVEPRVFDVDIHLIPASAKEAAHAHFDVRYAFQASSLRLEVSAEVRAARWVELAAVAALNPEESVIRCVERLQSWFA